MSIFRVGHIFEGRPRDDDMGCLSLCENEESMGQSNTEL